MLQARHLPFPLACALLAASTVSCVRERSLLPPPVPAARTFSGEGAAVAPDSWWTAFHSDELNSLIARALASSLDLGIAWERFREAGAIVDRERSALFPDVDGFLEGRSERGGSGFRSGQDRIEMGLAASYELDLWGRIESAVEANRFREEATQADYEAAQLSIAAEVAVTWLRLVEGRARRDLLRRQVVTNEKVLEQLENRFDVGDSRSVDVLRQEQLVSATRQLIPAEESRIGVLENRLAVLLGNPAQNGVDFASRALPSLPALPDTGVPGDLVQRRPDVRAALHRVEAANADVAAAISDQFPRITLSGSLLTEGGGAERLFDNWARSFAANLVTPLLDAGQRRAEVRRSEAVERRAVYAYGQAILVSFQEVEDALLQERKQGEVIRELRLRIDLAEKTYDQLFVEYTNGVSDFIDLLTALADLQALRRDLLEAERLRLEFRVSLYRALAGGIVTRTKGMPDS